MKYTLWLKIAAIFQMLTAVAHSLSFLVTPEAANETEKQMMDLMNQYSMDMGAGFHRTMHEIVTSLSATFALLYLFAGVLNWYLLSKKTDVTIMKGVILINVIVLGFCFVIIAYFTFLPPIVLTGLVFLFLLMSLYAITKSPENS